MFSVKGCITVVWLAQTCLGPRFGLRYGINNTIEILAFEPNDDVRTQIIFEINRIWPVHVVKKWRTCSHKCTENIAISKSLKIYFWYRRGMNSCHPDTGVSASYQLSYEARNLREIHRLILLSRRETMTITTKWKILAVFRQLFEGLFVYSFSRTHQRNIKLECVVFCSAC